MLIAITNHDREGIFAYLLDMKVGVIYGILPAAGSVVPFLRISFRNKFSSTSNATPSETNVITHICANLETIFEAWEQRLS